MVIESFLPVELMKRSSFFVLVAAYLILRPRMAFCSVKVIKLTYFNVFLFSLGVESAMVIKNQPQPTKIQSKYSDVAQKPKTITNKQKIW